MRAMSDAGLRELIGHEAIVLTRYRDSKGIWTVGVGHTAAAGPPDPATVTAPMSLAAVIALFRHDVARYEADVRAAVTVPVSATEFDALVSFHFNTGGIQRAELVDALNAGDRARAADLFMNWRKPPEIVPRRQKEQRLFRDGLYSNAGRATVYPADAEGRVQWGAGREVVLADLHPTA